MGAQSSLEQMVHGNKIRLHLEPTVDGLQKVPQPSKPTWVSVQDVVLNKLDCPRNQVNHSQSSATFTHTSNKITCLAHVAMVLVGVSRLDTK